MITLVLTAMMKKKLPTAVKERIVVRKTMMIFINFKMSWIYFVLLFIDLVNVVLTIYGSMLYFGDFNEMMNCFFEITILTNFMFVLILLGYVYFIRLLVTQLHFNFGIKIYKYLKLKCKCLKASVSELNFKKKFPIYYFSDLKSSSLESTKQSTVNTNSYGIDSLNLIRSSNISDTNFQVDIEKQVRTEKNEIDEEDDSCPICCEQF